MAKAMGIRILFYEGDPDWIEATFEKSHVAADRPFSVGGAKITEIMRELVVEKEVKNG